MTDSTQTPEEETEEEILEAEVESQESSTEIVRIPVARAQMNLDVKAAQEICNSSAIPEAIRGDRGAVFAIMQTGREMGIGPMRALRSFIMVKGNLGMKAQFLQALILSAGHTISFDEVSDEVCVLTGTRHDNQMTYTATFKIEEAKRAGLIKGSGWMKYPEDMCFARCISKLARRLFPDVVGGAYVEGEFEETIEEVVVIPPKPKNMKEAAAVVSGITVEDIPDADVIPETPATELATSEEVGRLSRLREELGMSKEQKFDAKQWIEDQGNGWTLGRYNGNSFIGHHIPLDAIDTIKRHFYGLVGRPYPDATGPRPVNEVTVDELQGKTISETQLRRLFAKLHELPQEQQDAMAGALQMKYGDISRKDLSQEQYDWYIGHIDYLKEGLTDAN